MGSIGVFDSGLGGLSVLRTLRKALPCESFIYLGDGERCPYGERSKEEVFQFTKEAVDRLLAEGCKLVVLACNTATAVAIKRLREEYPDIPFVGLEPAVKPAALSTKSGVIGVLATRRSLEGDHFRTTSEQYADKTGSSTVDRYVKVSRADRYIFKRLRVLVGEELVHFFYSLTEHRRLRIKVQGAVCSEFFLIKTYRKRYSEGVAVLERYRAFNSHDVG